MIAFASSANIEAQTFLLLEQNDTDYLAPHDTSCESQIDELASQVHTLLANTNDSPEQQFMYSTILLHLLLLQGKYSEITVRYAKSNFSQLQGSFRFNYTNVLAIKEAAIVGTAYEALNLFPEAIKVYEAADHLINDSISNSKEALKWAELLYYRFGMLATSLTWDDQNVTLSALHGYQKISKLIAFYPTPIIGDSASVQRRLSLLNLHFLYLSAIVQRNPEDAAMKEEVHGASKLFQETLFKSTAQITSKASNIPIEQFTNALFRNWQNTVHLHAPLDLVVETQDIYDTKELLTILRQAAVKTFHSCAIMRYLVFVLTALGEYEEALSAFEIYTAYQEKARIRQASFKSSASPDDMQLSGQVQSGDDDKSVVSVFSKAIDVMVLVKKDGVLAKDTADKLRSWLNNETLISSRGKSRKTRGHDRNISSASSIISAGLRDGFAIVWASIGRAYALYASQASTSEEREEVYELAVSSYENSLGYHPEDVQIFFDFALLLAENSQLKRAMKVVREGLMVDKTHILLWHLIALLLSAMEDYEKALQAVSNALGMFSEKANKLTASLLDSEKIQYLQLKMTQVALYEASEGIDKALELIPEVFTLYGELHPPVEEVKEVVPEIKDELDIVPTKSRLFIKNLKPGLGITKTLSRTPFRGHKHEPSVASAEVSVPRLSTASRVAPPSVPRLADKTSRNALNGLWLWAASLYRRGGLTEDAEEALIEAEKVCGLTAEAQVELGLLIKTQRPALALSEFEAALEKDKDNTRAIVALVHLIYDHSEISEEPEEKSSFKDPFEVNDVEGFKTDFSMLNEAYEPESKKTKSPVPETDAKKGNNNTHDSIFISRNDQLAAVTRAQGLLEKLLQSGRGFNCSEAWWLMSLIKEREGDKAGAAAALWKCVGLEESRGVRRFSVLEF